MPINYKSMILEKIAYPNDTEITMISTDKYDKMPFSKKWTDNAYAQLMKEGDIGVYRLLTWSDVVNYQKHNYDQVVVLGTSNKEIVIYGNKIGEQNIDKPFFVKYDIHRGDELLIKYESDPKQKIMLIHNITVEKMKYDQSLRYKQR